MKLPLRPIGTIHSPFESKEDCPIQSVYSSDTKGTIELFDEYAEGLKDIETFNHIILLYEFHQSGEIKLVRQTFLDDKPHGVFASRHPCRPNGIGLSIVKLLRCSGNLLHVEGIDVLNGTPLLDIKPYIPRFDCFPDASEGWVKSKSWREKPNGRE